MDTKITPQEALHHYREASQSWLFLRNEQSTAQLRLQALLLSADKPANYAWQVETLREKLEAVSYTHLTLPTICSV